MSETQRSCSSVGSRGVRASGGSPVSASSSGARLVEIGRQVSCPELSSMSLRDMMGRSSPASRDASDSKAAAAMRALISERAYTTRTPFATITARTSTDSPAAVAGYDQRCPGGSYQSHASMMNHRTRHFRVAEGPRDRFMQSVATSQDFGWQKQKLQPPKFPCNSCSITKSQSEIWKVTGSQGGR